jgi:hypothetical protein
LDAAVSYVVDRLDPSASPAELAEVLRQVAERFPDARLVRNQVGELNIMVPVDGGWRWAGFVALIEPGWSLA